MLSIFWFVIWFFAAICWSYCAFDISLPTNARIVFGICALVYWAIIISKVANKIKNDPDWS